MIRMALTVPSDKKASWKLWTRAGHERAQVGTDLSSGRYWILPPEGLPGGANLRKYTLNLISWRKVDWSSQNSRKILKSESVTFSICVKLNSDIYRLLRELRNALSWPGQFIAQNK